MHSITRRNFIQTAAAATGAFVLPRFSIGQPGASANSKLNIAMVGAGGIAHMAYNGLQGENIVALCDVDSNRLHEHAEKYPHIKKAATFSDFRVMFDKMGKGIDAVCIGTPDHTHFVATMAAMECGLHVYTQKPLTHNIWEARTLRKANEHYNLVTCMGNQGHTYDGLRQMREWVEADVFGQIHEVHSYLKVDGLFGVRPGYPLPPQESPVPASLDWDLWQGPCPAASFNKRYHPGGWRRWRQYGNGMLGDWFPHIADAPIWILDLYEPVAVEAETVVGSNEWLAPSECQIRFEFQHRGSKKPCTFYWHNSATDLGFSKPDQWTWGDELPKGGSLFFGEKTVGFTDNRSSNPRLANRDEMKAFKEQGYPDEKYPRVKGGPFVEWTRAIKGEGPEPGSNFEEASRFTEVMLLGALAARFGGRIEWDAKTMQITNRPELNQYLKDPVREGWSYGEDLWS